jgi:hypothetical protein
VLARPPLSSWLTSPASRTCTGRPGITLVLKVLLMPWLLHRLIERLNVRWDVETLINIPTTMLIGIVLVIFAFNLALPISGAVASTWRAARSASRWPACCCRS